MRGNRALPMPIAILILRVEGWQNGYCTSLENWRPQGLGGSNPSPSVFFSDSYLALALPRRTWLDPVAGIKKYRPAHEKEQHPPDSPDAR